MDKPILPSKDVSGIDAVLLFITKHCLFLLTANRYRIVDTLVAESFGGDCYVTLQSEALKIRIISDRSQLFLDFAASDTPGKERWFSIDLLRKMITQETGYHSLLDENNVEFLKRNLDEIESLFSAGNLPVTISRLKELEKERSKDRFG